VEVGMFSKKPVSGHVNVRAGGDLRYWIKIDTSKIFEPAVTGWFRASGGSKNDIALVLATEYEFENLIALYLNVSMPYRVDERVTIRLRKTIEYDLTPAGKADASSLQYPD
jgi:hypothetical protein